MTEKSNVVTFKAPVSDIVFQCPHCGGVEWAIILHKLPCQEGLAVADLSCFDEDCTFGTTVGMMLPADVAAEE